VLLKKLLGLWANALTQRFLVPAKHCPARAWHHLITIIRHRPRPLVALALVAALTTVLVPRLWSEAALFRALLRHEARAGLHEIHRLLAGSSESGDSQEVQR